MSICSCHPVYLLVFPHLVTHSDKWIVWRIPLSPNHCLGYFLGSQLLRGWGHSFLAWKLCPGFQSRWGLHLAFCPCTCKQTSPEMASCLLGLLSAALIYFSGASLCLSTQEVAPSISSGSPTANFPFPLACGLLPHLSNCAFCVPRTGLVILLSPQCLPHLSRWT